MNLDPSHGIAVFTDGSCSHRDRSGGWGWVALDAFEGKHTDSGATRNTTIGRMELAAATYALEQLTAHLGPIEVLVFSDAQYVVLGAMDPTRKRNVNVDMWKRLDKAIAGHDVVEFEHVKGHNNNLYNEMADRLAGEARKRGST